MAGVHSKCDRQGENPWLAGGILASLAGLFDHLEEGLCWCGMDDDHAVAITTKVLGAADRKEVSVSAPSCSIPHVPEGVCYSIDDAHT